jgi:hypothetical protein
MKTRPSAEEFFQADTQPDGRKDRHSDATCLFSH